MLTNPVPRLILGVMQRVNRRAGCILLNRLPNAFTRSEVVHDFHGVKLSIDTADMMGRRLYFHGEYEDDQLDVFLELLRPGDLVFDVGANIGAYALLAAARAARVIAIEPSRDVAAILRKNIALNGRQEEIELVQAAVSDTAGTVTFYEHRARNLGVGRIFPYGPSTPLGTYPVPCVTLDELAEIYGTPDLIKLDIEGAELPALRGARRLLASTVAPDILAEFHPGEIASLGGTVQDCLDILLAAGYRRIPSTALSARNEVSSHQWGAFTKRELP